MDKGPGPVAEVQQEEPAHLRGNSMLRKVVGGGQVSWPAEADEAVGSDSCLRDFISSKMLLPMQSGIT